MARPAVRSRFPADAASVGLARQLVARLLDDAGLAAVSHTVKLLVSETVTNAVLHAGTVIDVFCEVRPDAVRVEVADQSPVMPGLRRYELEATTGRGLSIVDMIATAWGVENDVDGKTVWFEVASPSAPTAEPSAPPLGVSPPVAG